MTLAPGTQLGPYEIVSQLGQGGMGVVYQATDPRLRRTVAIKLLPPDLTRDETAKQRFLQEAQAASALDHPNICTIFEINETDDGQLYLVMAHYEGETLKERTARGPLELDDAIDIATQVGEGLAKAHAAGIVHRDIKPANLIVTADETVKILDFGLAKLAGTEGMTQTGTTLGTVAYMSPEQAKGQEVDHRTDIWSLGVVLYEMLAGQPPFQGENLLSISNAILESDQPSLTGPSLPAQGVISRSLSKNREERYQSVSGLLGELRPLHSSPDAPTVVATAQPEVPSVAVLPFANMSADPEQEYFCEGLAEELIDALARLEHLHVVSRTSAFQFRGKGHDLRQVAEQLKVRTVLEGSVRKAGNRLRVNVQLINAADGYHLWSERYDRDMDDVFAVQDEIAQTVVTKLKVKLLGVGDAPLVTRPTDNLEAYNLVLKGRYHRVKLTAKAIEQSLQCFTQALAIAPDYAAAHAGVAGAHVVQAMFGGATPSDVMPRAQEAARQALALDDSEAAAHYASALVLQYFDWDWAGAEQAYRRALALNPGDAPVRSSFAMALGGLGRADESLTEARRAVELDPVSAYTNRALALSLLHARRFDEAREQARKTLDLDPAYLGAYVDLGMAAAAMGDTQEAVRVCREGYQLAPDEAQIGGVLGWANGLAGRREEALRIFHHLEQRGGTPFFMSVLCLGLGERSQALAYLEQAWEDRDGLLMFINVSFPFDPLRSDPRFQALLRRMDFPAAASPDASTGA